MQNLQLSNLFLSNCLVNKVVPNFIYYRIVRSKLKVSPTIERTFVYDEIGKNKQIINHIKLNYLEVLRNASSWLTELDKLRFFKHLVFLDRSKKKEMLSKHNKTILFLKEKRFGKRVASTQENIKNFSSHVLSATESFVLSHGLKFSVAPNGLKREIVFAEFESLACQLKHHTHNKSKLKKTLNVCMPNCMMLHMLYVALLLRLDIPVCIRNAWMFIKRCERTRIYL